MLKDALKEWAIICHVLGEGRQSLIFRKGGLEDIGGTFQPEQKRFWLYPTYVHQQRAGIKPEASDWFDLVEAHRPPTKKIRLSHFAETSAVYHLHDLAGAFVLAPYHIYSEKTVQSRFAYRSPGLYALMLRVHRIPDMIELTEAEHYAGCRSWVELDHGVSTEGAVPVLDAGAFARLSREVDHLLRPIALA